MNDRHTYRRPDKNRVEQETKLIQQKRKQSGVSFPSAAKQEHVLIVRFDLQSGIIRDPARARNGLRSLCTFLQRIDKDMVKLDVLSEDGSLFQHSFKTYNFSATLGFGAPFFEKLDIELENRPRRLYSMPDHLELLDPVPYVLSQTDMILQIGSSKDFVNRKVLHDDAYYLQEDQSAGYGVSEIQTKKDDGGDITDIDCALREWAVIKDIHSGFQRIDGRNLMGFNDGVSNPDRLQNDVIWTTEIDEKKELKDGSYMVFQKIAHDLEYWRRLGIREQEKWVGRRKATGLLVGTLSKEEDNLLARECQSSDPARREAARSKLNSLIKKQVDPEKQLFEGTDPTSKRIQLECPVWSHVRKANPRGSDEVPQKIIYRRGYLFATDDFRSKYGSGILFICFQRDIANGFEYIKKRFLNNKSFPVPEARKQFSTAERAERRRHARFSEAELSELGAIEKSAFGFNPISSKEEIEQAYQPDSQNTGREGLSGPSKLGVNPTGEYNVTVTLGGGYYFVPPIPGKDLTRISEQFFV